MSDDNTNTNTSAADAADAVAYLDSEEIDKVFVCPITQMVYVDPVMADDQQTYERDAIEQHIKTCQTNGTPITSPLTRKTTGTKLMQNRAVKTGIETLVDQNVFSPESAAEWRKSCEQKRLIQKALDGDVESMIALGMHKFQGTDGFLKDQEGGLKLLEKAHDKGSGDAVAAYKLGWRLAQDGEKQCMHHAFHFFGVSACGGCDAACFHLAEIMMKVPNPMVKRAIHWLKVCSVVCRYKIMDESEKSAARDLLCHLESQNQEDAVLTK